MKAIILILGLIVYANCELGAVTHCGNIFVTEVAGLNTLKNNVLKKCQELLANNSLTEENGCLQCNSRLIYNLFPYEKGIVALSFCMGSTLTCETKYTGNMEQLFNNFMDLMNTSEKVSALLEKEIELKKTTIDKDVAPSTNAITGKIIRHTSTSLTYEISTTLDSPIKCFKTLTSTEPEFPTGSTYYILQPRTSKRVFTESFTASDYDCQTYSLHLKCVPLPYQENVSSSTSIKLFTVNHKTETTSCKIVDPDEPIPPTPTPTPTPSEEKKESVPTMQTYDPMIVNETEISIARSLSSSEEKENFLAKNFKTFESEDKFVNKMNQVIRANKVLEVIDCESGNCKEQKKQIQNNCWKSIKDEIQKDDKSIVENLDAKPEEFEKNTKILFQTMIVSFGNNDSFHKESAQDALNVASKALSSSTEIIEKLNTKEAENKEAIKEDVINLMVTTASSMFQLTNVLGSTNNEENLVNKEEDVKTIQKAIDNVAKCLIINKVNEKKTVNFIFSFIQFTNSRLRRLDDNSYVYSNLEDGIEVVIPKEYVSKLDQGTGIKIVNYKSYPFITQSGSKYFSNKVVSVELVNEQDGTTVNAPDMDKNNKIEVFFKKDTIDSSFNTCYMFDNAKDSEPSTDNVTVDSSKNGYLGCQISKLGNVLVGNYNTKQGLPGYAIFLIVFSVLLVLGISGFLVWKFVIQRKLEKDKMTSLNETPKEMAKV